MLNIDGAGVQNVTNSFAWDGAPGLGATAAMTIGMTRVAWSVRAHRTRSRTLEGGGIPFTRWIRPVVLLAIGALVASSCTGTSRGPSESGGRTKAPITESPQPVVSGCTEGSGLITTVAGNQPYEGADDQQGWRSSGDGGPATQAQLDLPIDVAVDTAGNLYILEHAAHPPLFNAGRIRKVDPSGRISTVVGPPTEGGVAAPGEAGKLELKAPLGMTLDTDGDLYVAVSKDHQVVRVDPSGEVNVVAGTGKAGFSGMGGPATEARFNDPEDLSIDHDGNLYIGDGYDRRILKVDPSGVITTFAGTGKAGDSGDGGPADEARISGVRGLAVDTHGSVYVAEPDSGVVRKIDRSGIIQTVAGGGNGDNLGDGGLATRATLVYPTGVWVDDRNLYITEAGRHRIRRVDRSGVITTIAGTGEQGFSGDGGPAIEATLNEPQTVVVGPDNALYIADFENARVRKVCL